MNNIHSQSTILANMSSHRLQVTNEQFDPRGIIHSPDRNGIEKRDVQSRLSGTVRTNDGDPRVQTNINVDAFE